MTENITIINVQDFIASIEKLVDEKGIDHIDAVMYFCEKNGLEVETAADMIKSNTKLKAKVKIDAESLGYLPKSAKLPI